MQNYIKANRTLLLYLLPTLILCLYVLVVSYTAPLHDFSNSYFSARLLHEGIAPETVIFDIHAFNTYIWDLGYKNVFVDFYVNSPFTLAVFYPLAYIENPYVAKFVFNSFSIIFFLTSLYVLAKWTLAHEKWILLCIPVLFYVPIRNQILFGQSYFCVLFCVVMGFYFWEKKKMLRGSLFLGFAALFKFFPVFYAIPLFVQKRWKLMMISSVSGLCSIAIGILITGYPLWELYFTDILPHTFLSKTTTDYRVNYQSLEVFLKYLFVEDAYYNPRAWIADERIFIILKSVFKAIVIGSAIAISLQKKKHTSVLLAIWVTVLFLIQSRTATYAQVLWVIPLFVVLAQPKMTLGYKILGIVCIVCICNFPFHKLQSMPLYIQFSRLWLVLLFSIYCYRVVSRTIYLKPIILILVLMLPTIVVALKARTEDGSTYVLSEKKHFMIYDFFNQNGKLAYKTLGKNGDEINVTAYPVTRFDTTSVVLKDHDLYLNGQLIPTATALKKKPVLVDNSKIYFLTDHRSRRAAFTLKCITINHKID